MQLRYYQRDAIDSLYKYLETNNGNPLIVLPTGTGKSLVIAQVIEELTTQWPSTRILIATHSKELVSQNYAEFINLSPFAPAGIFSAGLNRRDSDAQILFCGIQSIYRRAYDIQRCDILLIDEAHTISQKGSGMWHQFITEITKINPDMRIVGLTATDYRLDSGLLTTGDNRLFHDVCYEYGLLDAIKDGYLCPIIPSPMATKFDLSGVGTRMGEWKQDELESAINIDSITRKAIDEIEAYGQDRKSWLIFACGNKHAEAIHLELKRRGYDGACVTEKTKKVDRDAAVSNIRNRKIRYLVNNVIFTTGFNAPNIDLIADLAPTKSPGRHVQKAGRGTRCIGANIEESIANGKANCISEGSLVLTDTGLIPIEKITKEMKVWDGVEFVSHCGIIFRGTRNCIEYAGLIATPDHKVLTKNGWRSFEECSRKGVGIRVAEKYGQAIQLSENIFRKDRKKERIKKVTYFNHMCHLRKNFLKRIYELGKRKSRLPEMWEDKAQGKTCLGRSKMAVGAMQFCQAKMHKSEKLSLQGLWWSGDRVSIRNSKLYGEIYNREFCFRQKLANRQNRQQWSLRTRKYKDGKSKNKYEQSKNKLWHKAYAFIQKGVSRCYVRGQHHYKLIESWVASERNRAPILQFKIMQTERRVWDILNCGPRNSFCANGLIVHNCILLDFARNVDYHGPLDKIRGKDKTKGEGGDAPMKVCPECHQVCFAGLRKCFACGYEFEGMGGPDIRSHGGDAAVLSTQIEPEWYTVNEMYLNRHAKEGKIPSMRVDYYDFVKGRVSEWICFEHTGFARQKAEKWHRVRLYDAPVPCNVDEAIELPYPKPAKILVRWEGKYARVIDYDFRVEDEVASQDIQEISKNDDYHKEDDDEYYEIKF